MAAARPQVNVYGGEGKDGQVAMPEVLLAPIRSDIVQFVFSNMAKNKRQAYGVSRAAGHQHSAHSWGTGRAVSRIPRVSGSGTSRAGQAAFGNMCRKGRMFAPTRIWRKWHRKINTNQKRYAVTSALAASALPSLVMARGHRIGDVPEIPLVVNSSVEGIAKTKDAVKFLKSVGAYNDVERVRNSRKIRAGKGKLRNRRFTQKRGPLMVVAGGEEGARRAFRNIPGVEIADVETLNLLQLAPGGHMGRFIIWSEDAFKALAGIWGSTQRVSTQKKGYKLPRSCLTNSDISRIINSAEIQGNPKLNPAKTGGRRKTIKSNPLRNKIVMDALNPYAAAMRKAEQALQRSAAERKKLKAKRRAAQKVNEIQKRVNYAKITTDYAVLTKADLDQKIADDIAAAKAAKDAEAARIKAAEEEQARVIAAKKAAIAAAEAKEDAAGGDDDDDDDDDDSDEE